MISIANMHQKNLNAIDLNLLKVFSALAAERSVTKAANSVGLSQPAVSHALRRLRDLMDDELFIRSTDGMQPTERCRELAPAIDASLKMLQDAMTVKDDNDPANLRATYRLGMNDLFSTLLVPGLTARVAKQAPNVSLRFLHSMAINQNVDDAYSDLERGRIDLTVIQDFDTPSRFDRELLGASEFVCVARAGHPLFQPGLSMEQYTSLGHIMFTTLDAEYSRIDEALSKMGIRRRIELRVPHYSAALSATALTDLVYTVPRILVPHAEQAFGLQVSELPFEAPFRKIFQVWHRTRTKDFGHQWLRNVVSDVSQLSGIVP
ncbi:LysR family transcriptional regulator [Pseudoruegeria sp. M32A2M]|nr:LysR family transcriptional regulator [Pseudoruegeria sp. M32A2M]